MQYNSKLPSNRNFGLLLAAMFFILSGYGLFNDTGIAGVQFWLITGIIFVFVAVFFPKVLAPLNKAWMKVGEVMGQVVSPVVLGIIFFLILTPVAMLCRIFGRDVLRLRKVEESSYWIVRAPPGPLGDSFKNQF